MFKRILVAYDGSDEAQAALRMGVDLAKALGTGLAGISVQEHLPRYAETITEIEGAKDQIEQHFRVLTKQARDLSGLAGVELETTVRRGHQVEEIVAFAREGRFDLLILGSRGHGRMVGRLIGSTSRSVARLAPCSVLIARTAKTGAPPLKRIVVGLDGSPLGRLAFRLAVDLAILHGAGVVAVTVNERSPLAIPGAFDGTRVAELRAAAEEHARAAGVAFEHVTLTGHAAKALRDRARETEADLLVLGATGLEQPWSATIGGTAASVVSEAPCSLLLVRSPQASLHARDVMIRAVSTVTEDAPLTQVVELLLRRDVKALPVVDARTHVVGIITGGDLLNRGDLELRLSIGKELDPETLRERLQALARSGRSARDVMTRHVLTVGADVDLFSVVRLMVSRRVKRLPVVGREGELLGIVSRADILRSIAALPESRAPGERPLPAAARTVGDAVTIDVPVVSPEAPADEVLSRVLESPLRRVVVAGADGRVRGLISDRDLLVRSSPDTRPWVLRMLWGRSAKDRSGRPTGAGGALTAAALMAPSLITVRPEDSLVHAIRLMMQHQVKRIIVVDEAGRFRGLVDRREVLRLLAEGPRA